jgi:hypothetical protein
MARVYPRINNCTNCYGTGRLKGPPREQFRMGDTTVLCDECLGMPADLISRVFTEEEAERILEEHLEQLDES